MASNSSKNIDHGNYIPSPIVPGIKIADGEHLRKVFVLGSADAAAGADIAESSALRIMSWSLSPYLSINCFIVFSWMSLKDNA